MRAISGLVLDLIKGVFKNSDFFVRVVLAPRAEPECTLVHEDLSTEPTPLSRKKCIFRDALKFTSVILIATLLTGCGSVAKKSAGQNELDSPEPRRHASPDMSLPDLMLRRQQLCLISPTGRLRLLDNYRAVFIEKAATLESLPGTEPKSVHQLQALMLASCDPAHTPGVLSEMLAVVTENHWPAAYMAFFDVLVTQHSAYVRLNEQHWELREKLRTLQKQHKSLQADYEALQTEHQKTIEGISDIERGIDMPQSEDIGL